MRRFLTQVVAGLLVTALGAVGVVAFVQTAQPVGPRGSTLVSADDVGNACPALSGEAIDQSCQDIHRQFLTEGNLTAADYARIMDEWATRDLVTCIKTSRRPQTLDGVI